MVVVPVRDNDEAYRLPWIRSDAGEVTERGRAAGLRVQTGVNKDPLATNMDANCLPKPPSKDRDL
jgi:hypothetical protein